MLPQLLSCAYSYKYLEVLWLPKRTKLWACFNTEPNRLYRRLRLFPSKLQEYTPPPFSRLSTQYHIDPLLTCFLSLDTSRTSLQLQQSTKFGNRHTAHGRYEYSYNLANSRENWAQKKKSLPGGVGTCSSDASTCSAGTSLIALSLHGWWMWKSSGDCEADWECGTTETVQVTMWELLEGRLIEIGRGLRASRLLNHGGLSVSLREASSAHAYI